MTSAPYMPWYPADFLVSTRGWSVTARGCYRDLLDTQWDKGTLPAAPGKLQKLIGATDAEWREGWVECEGKFPISKGDGMRRNQRLEIIRKRVLQEIEAKRRGGAKGGKASKDKRLQAELGPMPVPTYQHSDSDSDSDTDQDIRSGVLTLAPVSLTVAHRAARNGSAHGSRIPDDFQLTPEQRTYATDLGIDAERTYIDFFEFWKAKPGAGGRKVDWNLTWKTWCRKAGDESRERQRKAAPRKTRYEELQERRHAIENK